jgi:predicted nuclease of predicted toxin-antitoxin system
MWFLVDAQLPPALALFFEEQGHEGKAVRDVGLRDADDAAI